MRRAFYSTRLPEALAFEVTGSMGVVASAHLCRSCSFGPAALWIAGWVRFTSFCKGEDSKIARLDRLVERIDRGELDLISAGRAPFADSGLAR